MHIKILHSDHGLSADALLQIGAELADTIERGGFGEGPPDRGFFIKTLHLNTDVPCALHGPSMGDQPISEDDVSYSNRGLDREWDDRIVARHDRMVDYVQAIGTVEDDGTVTLYTVYGGPLAPQHPDDPTNQHVAEARVFWAQHALSGSPAAEEAFSDADLLTALEDSDCTHEEWVKRIAWAALGSINLLPRKAITDREIDRAEECVGSMLQRAKATLGKDARGGQ